MGGGRKGQQHIHLHAQFHVTAGFAMPGYKMEAALIVHADLGKEIDRSHQVTLGQTMLADLDQQSIAPRAIHAVAGSLEIPVAVFSSMRWSSSNKPKGSC